MVFSSCFPSSSLHHETQCSWGYPVTAKQWAGHPLGMKTSTISSFRSCCPSIDSDGALPCMCQMALCASPSESFSTWWHRLHTYHHLYWEVLQHWCPISKVQAVPGRIRPGHRQSKIRPLPVPHGVDFWRRTTGFAPNWLLVFELSFEWIISLFSLFFFFLKRLGSKGEQV